VSGLRILLADDERPILDLLVDILEEAGHSTAAATSGPKALRLLQSVKFDVAILDWMMPEPDGPALCEIIRTQTAGNYTYTFLMSGRTAKDDIVKGLRSGADDYLCKPIFPQELLLRIDIAKRILSLGSRQIAIFAMAKLAESRDQDTGQHLERIRSFSWLLAKRLAGDFPELTPEFLDNIYHTSPLHDIGKVGIPDYILLKPDRLTDQEFEVMKTHTVIGAETLDATLRQHPDASYFKMAREITLTHHETFDGSGYPQGLCGHDIPLSGRIVCLADIYDALTSQRPYKRPFDHETAKGIILQRQSHFDPLVLSAFLDLEDEFLAIRNAFLDPDPREQKSDVA
jgi:putative two-component system response regulator